MDNPYSDIILEDNEVIRLFDQNLDESELKWHRDDEYRIVTTVKPTDWLFQRENSLPEKIQGEIHIPRGQWHRTIKGSGELIIKVKKIYTYT